MAVNLKILAEHLGLSQATVSRGLNGFPEVNEQTRKRIREAARQLGYQPNLSAQRLATGRANSVGFVFRTDRNIFVDAHFTEFLAGMANRLSVEGIDLTFAATSSDDEHKVYERFARTRRADVLIVSSPTTSDERIQLLQGLSMPFVVHGRCSDKNDFHFYDIDNRGGFELATNHLTALGHTLIGFINGDRLQNFAMEREIGYRNALQEAGLAAKPHLMSNSLMSEGYGYENALRMLSSDEPPTALLCSSPLLAAGAARAVERKGLVLGKDIAMVAHDDMLPVQVTEQMDVPLTVIRSPIRDGGHGVADIAIQLMSAKSGQLAQKVAPVELLVRQSSCPPPH